MTKKGSKYAIYIKSQVDRLLASDPKFKSELIADPEKALEHRLKIKMPHKTMREVLEFLRQQFSWLRQGGSLSDQELGLVAGGVGEIQELPRNQIPTVQPGKGDKVGDKKGAPVPQKPKQDEIMTADVFAPASAKRGFPRSNKI